MTYKVKEIYFSLQGEGYHTGRPAVLIRFTGCNLWSGHERDRPTAICRFCDTDFVGTDGPGGGRFASASEVAGAAAAAWNSSAAPFAVLTGGEPLLQLDRELIDALHASDFEIAVETNGTLRAPVGIDWLCVSPKAGAPLEQRSGDELKLVYPQEGAWPEQYRHLEFDHFFLQPMDGPDLANNTSLAIEYCRRHPEWKLSLQTHKLLGVP